MLNRVPKLKAVGATLLLAGVFFYAPIVPYVQSVYVPGSYAQGYSACIAGISQTNLTLAEVQRQRCQESFRAPPNTLFGFSTPSYSVLGYGSPPFPPQKLTTQGNHSALVFFSGGKAVAVEEGGPAGLLVNPSSILSFQAAAVTSFDFGILNLTVRILNIGYYDVSSPAVYISMEGYSSNGTLGGLTLIQPKFLGSCDFVLTSNEYCQVSRLTPNYLPVNQSFTFYVEVRGSVRDRPFIYRQGLSEYYPRGGIGPLWVSAFIAQMNAERGGPPLKENSTLDAFAEFRFKNASSVYQISDYGLNSDIALYFGPNARIDSVAEELLFPGTFSPSEYPTFLSTYAPGHWLGLDNPVYRQYGYFVGHAPYFLVNVPCPVYEIPRAGMNISQYFSQNGCTTTVASTTWLVLILSP